jgi:type I restriction enzyme R subunit
MALYGYARVSSADQDYSLQEARKLPQNISYFAFTATPKNKTLELFGTKREDGKREPFHLYSMKQAI